MKRVMLLVVMALAMMSATSFSLAAQELTAEEIAARLLLQKTRGLVIAPADGTAATVAGEGTAVTPAEYVPLNADEQVNIRISFEFDSAALSASEKPKLQTMCEVMKSVDVNIFKIVGHTDASGTAEYNQRLSKLRAEEVKRFMVEDCGVSGDRLQAVGVGEEFPVDAADPRSDQNRRVEFQALS